MKTIKKGLPCSLLRSAAYGVDWGCGLKGEPGGGDGYVDGYMTVTFDSYTTVTFDSWMTVIWTVNNQLTGT